MLNLLVWGVSTMSKGNQKNHHVSLEFRSPYWKRRKAWRLATLGKRVTYLVAIAIREQLALKLRKLNHTKHCGNEARWALYRQPPTTTKLPSQKFSFITQKSSKIKIIIWNSSLTSAPVSWIECNAAMLSSRLCPSSIRRTDPSSLIPTDSRVPYSSIWQKRHKK